MEIYPQPKPVKVKLSQYEKVAKQFKKLRSRGKGLVEVSPGKYTLRMTKKRPLKATLRKKRVKLPSIKKLIKQADILFARYIRTRDMERCVLCGSTRNPNCGHLIKRSKKPTRYSEINCSCLCSGCNYKDNFDHEPYVLWFINKWGAEKYKLLYEYSQEFHKWTREELLDIIKKYSCTPPNK